MKLSKDHLKWLEICIASQGQKSVKLDSKISFILAQANMKYFILASANLKYLMLAPAKMVYFLGEMHRHMNHEEEQKNFFAQNIILSNFCLILVLFFYFDLPK